MGSLGARRGLLRATFIVGIIQFFFVERFVVEFVGVFIIERQLVRIVLKQRFVEFIGVFVGAVVLVWQQFVRQCVGAIGQRAAELRDDLRDGCAVRERQAQCLHAGRVDLFVGIDAFAL